MGRNPQMNKEIIKKGFDEAEKSHQEAAIQQIKNIVQNTLEKIDAKTEQRTKLDKEIQLLKKDIDDLKAGRLDRMEERQTIDPDAKRLSVVVIKRVEKEFIPYMPWRSPYEIVWNVVPDPLTTTWTSGTSTLSTGTWTLDNTGTTEVHIPFNLSTGTMFQNFTGGSYQIGGRIINL